jgi:hypothetical protein
VLCAPRRGGNAGGRVLAQRGFVSRARRRRRGCWLPRSQVPRSPRPRRTVDPAPLRDRPGLAEARRGADQRLAPRAKMSASAPRRPGLARPACSAPDFTSSAAARVDAKCSAALETGGAASSEYITKHANRVLCSAFLPPSAFFVSAAARTLYQELPPRIVTRVNVRTGAWGGGGGSECERENERGAHGESLFCSTAFGGGTASGRPIYVGLKQSRYGEYWMQ